MLCLLLLISDSEVRKDKTPPWPCPILAHHHKIKIETHAKIKLSFSGIQSQTKVSSDNDI